MYLVPAFLFIILAAFFLYRSTQLQKRSGLPGGRVIYSDMNRWGPNEEALYDATIGLTGRPDYLIQQGNFIIPVEVKTGRVPSAPYDSHIFQVAAYCYLVEKSMGQRPPYGIIHYGKRSFAVDYTKEMELALLDLISEIRGADRKRKILRSHQQAARCNGCGFSFTCDQKI